MTMRRQNPPAKLSGRPVLLYFFVSFMAGASGADLALAQASKPMPFLAHRAIYDLSVEADPSRPMVDAARGRIVFEFSGSDCEGYTQNFRQVAELEGSEFGRRLIDSRSLIFEESDGKTMRYSGSVTINDADPQETEGQAEKSDDMLHVALTKPDAEKVDLKGMADYPTAHYQHLVAAALKGDSTFEAKVFDGNGDGKTISDTFAIIGKTVSETNASEPIKKAGFGAMKRWPITISYFDGEGQERETPSYVMSMELLENGVADALVLNYGDFVLKGTLRQIESLPQHACP